MSRLDEVVGLQHSIVTWSQLVDLGAHPSWIKREESAGRLVRIAPSVYRMDGARHTWEMRALSALLSCRAPALVSHRSAAGLWRLTSVLPGVIDVTVPRHRRPGKRPGVRFHESRAFDLGDPRVLDRVAVTSVARTILDCCADVGTSAERLELLDEARRLRLVSWDELWLCHQQHSGRRHPGLARFGRLLVERNGEVPPDSTFVRLVATLLEEAGLPVPLFDYPVLGGRYRIDMAWDPTRRRVALECDGGIAHAHEAAQERDPVRRNRIRLDGWLLLEVTWARYRSDPTGIVAEVRAALGP